ncbi:RNA polymerase III transcription factor TFIIIC subunit (Tfc4), putative [Talaromyces stipitatus ATCC 10500]|uniref:RNA polymerase III transcription factor TFIIIC subunit (Tfc4), putative n=1 Tax=Talaromyces stipitatus (strain ATCC 10500 / CBS 375.48 / QM 6759 / NRRL 1006) TaxID=441959 RepID=B8MH28_TALSN|nr:RNA polymerase III transcription factor TFIIIC subunit (Tfc4), putative [Talaromyces stipitatus ATCC 10500]EED16842.1 RNA polymerase III transcription factor TFIIIC subunit (Tfc4), putative [Talaromyces stipitatus ATCC 10500]
MASSENYLGRVGDYPDSSYQEDQPSLDPAIDPRLFDSSYLPLEPGSGDVAFEDFGQHGPLNTASMSIGQRRLLQEQVDLSGSEEESDDEYYDDNDDPVWNGGHQDYEGSTDAESEEDDGYDPNDAASPPPRKRRRRGHGPFSGRFGARGGKGIKRGPRRPLEPSPEFKMLHSQATEAFIDGDYDRAIDLVQKAILVNPEMFAAHSLLSEIFLARGEKDKAVSALFSGAHTRPRDPTVWHKVARLIQDRAGEDRQKTLNDMIYCYSRIIEIDSKSYNARFQRAAAYRELGYNGRAATEYERILKELPHNIRALRHLAETYIDMKDVRKALQYYLESIEYYMSLDNDENMEFSWSDVNICAELYAFVGEPEAGLQLLSSVSRWLLGRKDDKIWDEYIDDDREWDAGDSPRRIKTDGFIPNAYPIDSYGLGLPMELRIKLGTFRLKLGERYFEEALAHFEWLNPDDTSESSTVFDYADLYREAADALKDSALFPEALRFYRPLQLTEDYADVSFFLAMGECAFACSDLSLAESCYLTVAENDSTNLQSRVNLAKLYETMGERDRALYFVNQAVLLGRESRGRNRRRRKDRRIAQLAKEFQGDAHVSTRIVPRHLANEVSRREALQDSDANRPQQVQYLYSKMNDLRPRMRDGDTDATEDWLDIADALLHDFRTNRVFYPLQKNMIFLGYSREEQKGARKKETVMGEVQEVAERLKEWIGQYNADEVPTSIPNDYYGISFDEWFEIFLEYAFVVSGQGDKDEAYDVLAAAADASVWYHSKDKVRQIHICWITCALRAYDEETLVSEARWFTKEYPFVTDTYRLFSMLSRICGDPNRSLFHASPSMKFMLRQVKFMDSTLPEDHYLTKTWTSKSGVANKSMTIVTRNSKNPPKTASLTKRGENAEPITADDMDVALLVLYGNILYSGNSFYPALNYYYRAIALDPDNPGILLPIALCYIHHALKRQADNRHYLILQGLSFMSLYRRARSKSEIEDNGDKADNEKTQNSVHSLTLQQEVEFNYGRVYHSLGLLHQAVPCYERALELGDQIKSSQNEQNGAEKGKVRDFARDDKPEEDLIVEDFSPEAAVALQNIYALNGNIAGARKITEKYLII